jgi:sterol desaturase/sphingolipid hydroxylase (fatty acid hydroxylase superfamily)
MNITTEYLTALGCTAALSAVFYAAERRNYAGVPPRVAYLANYVYVPFYLAGVYLLQLRVGPLFSRFANETGGGVLMKLAPPQRSLYAEVLLTAGFVVIWDIWQYWVHRWQHASPLLWQVHKLHHSDSFLNSGSQGRHHVLSYVLNLLCYLPMLLLFGTFGPNVFVAFLMFRLWGFVNHANVRISFGLLTPVVAGPQWHRIHHSVQHEHLDKNFATLFPAIDRVFGTYYEPGRDEYPPTGLISDNRESFLRQATISPVLGWYRSLRRTSGSSNLHSA